jgi:uncharacterized protein YggU (UPF0235/DUF167 family)
MEDKANEALLRFLAKEWDIPLSRMEIIKGHHFREKTLKITGATHLEFLKGLGTPHP